MIITSADIPPVNALVVFESVARHMSFTAASRELGVSQAAVSQQVKLLEENLKLTLFLRTRPTIGLTAEGQILAAAVRAGLDSISEAVRTIRPRDRGRRLTVTTLVAFSSFWLMPRLPGFHGSVPEAELRLLTSDADMDWGAEEIDLAIVYGQAPWKGYQHHRLFGDQVMAVAHPALAAKMPKDAGCAQLLDVTLLHQEAQRPEWVTWEQWLQHFGVPIAAPLRGPRFNSNIHLIQSALEGQGVALGWRRLVELHLARGDLVPVVPERLVPDYGFYLIIPETLTRRPVVRAFKDWIVSEAAADWS